MDVEVVDGVTDVVVVVATVVAVVPTVVVVPVMASACSGPAVRRLVTATSPTTIVGASRCMTNLRVPRSGSARELV